MSVCGAINTLRALAAAVCDIASSVLNPATPLFQPPNAAADRLWAESRRATNTSAAPGTHAPAAAAEDRPAQEPPPARATQERPDLDEAWFTK
jgi:hypothetical protein